MHFLVSLFDSAQILTKPVLVHGLARLAIPESAAIRRKLIREKNIAIPDVLAELELEIDELQSQPR